MDNQRRSKMTALWTIAGFILGWIAIEVVAVFSKVAMPVLLNIGLGLVGALAAYTIVTH